MARATTTVLTVAALLAVGDGLASSASRRRIPPTTPPPILRDMPSAVPIGISRAVLERTAFDLVNRHRRARGLAELVLDERVSRAARRHSDAMAAGWTPVGHEGFSERSDLLYRLMSCHRSAENVAMNHGYPDPASAALDGWLASAGHRRNLEGEYEWTGVGVAVNAADEIFFTQLFVGQ